ncbi:MAG: right-handed parallel beta-helix repeat-containing protein [Candidatus Micrarchaeota archaeon]
MLSCKTRPLLAIILLLVVVQLSHAAPIEVSGCGIFTTSNQDYVLNQSIVGNLSTVPVCLLFNASNISVNCAGYSITGNSPDTIGIAIADPADFFPPLFSGSGILQNVTLKNCNISNYTSAGSGVQSSNIFVYKTSGFDLTDNILYMANTSLYVLLSENGSVYNNTISANTLNGVYFDSSSNNSFAGNNIYNSTIGIELIYSNGNNFTGNNITNITFVGIASTQSNGTLVAHNNISNVLPTGPGYSIAVSFGNKSNNCTVISNVLSNTILGFNIDSSHGCVVANNTINGTYLGYHFVESNYSIIDNNTAYSSNQTFGPSVGFDSNSANYNNYTNNRAYNFGIGFEVYGNLGCCGPSSNILIANNTADGSTIGIMLEDSSQYTTIDNFIGFSNNISILVNGTTGVNITNSRFSGGVGTVTNSSDPMGIPASILVYNSSNGLIENASVENSSVTALLMWNAAELTVRNLSVSNCTAPNLPFQNSPIVAIYPNSRNITITQSSFTNRVPSFSITGITHWGNSSNITIDRCLFENLSNGFVGNIVSCSESPLLCGGANNYYIINSTFRNNFMAINMQAWNSFIYDTNVTNSLLFGIELSGTGYNKLRNNNMTNNGVNFVLGGDDVGTAVLYGLSLVHDYAEQDIDTSNTINGRPMYYYSTFGGNVPAPGFVVPTNGSFYACVDCTDVLFENLTVENVSHAFYAGFSNNITSRNISGKTLRGIRYFASNNSESYNNRLSIIDALRPWYPLLPSDFATNNEGFGIVFTENVTMRDSEVVDGITGFSVMVSNNSKIQNINITNMMSSKAMGFVLLNNSTIENITVRNLSGQLPLTGFPEVTISVSNSTGNTFRNINLSQVNTTGATRGYYSSLANSANIVENAIFERPVASFAEHDIYITKGVLPALPASTASLNRFLEIQNNSMDSWINLTMFYASEDIPAGDNENTISMWKQSGAWTKLSSTLNTANKSVFAAIANFSSVFALLVGVPSPTTPSSGGDLLFDMSYATACPDNALTVHITAADKNLSEVIVKLLLNGQLLRTVYTDDNGNAKFTLTQNGTYDLITSKSGYRLVDTGNFDYATCQKEPPPKGCTSDADCSSDKYCAGVCTPVTGTCGYASDHRWVAYTCCADGDCAGDEYCGNHDCKKVTGVCGHAADHTWLTYACGPESECPLCAATEKCTDRQCVPVAYELSAPTSAFVGDTIAITAYADGKPLANTMLAVTLPDGSKRTVITDANGNVQLLMDFEGNYTISMLSDGTTLESVSLLSNIKPQPQLPGGKPIALQDYCLAALLLLLVIAAIAAAYWYYRNRRRRY